MNRYKMISICSFMITCVLIMSLLLPVKTTANDEESLELNMHYENSQVTANIIVNSDVYTGVVCKYIIIDDVLKSDDLLTQTKESGTTINLNKSDSDEYQTIIPNVTKRYVVIYVSIGECSLCDYIDCKPTNTDASNTQGSDENAGEQNTQGNNLEAQGESVDGQKTETNGGDNSQANKEGNTEQMDNQKDESNSDNSTDNNKSEDKTAEENKAQENNEGNKGQENVNSQPEAKKDENNEQKVEAKTEEKTEQKSESKQEDKIVVDNKTDNGTNGFESIEESSNKKEDTAKSNSELNAATSQKGTTTTGTNSEKASKTNSELKTTNSSYDKDSVNVGSSGVQNKDSIDISDFQEIEKTVTTSTASDNMPKTGEDDFVKIMGIVVFSALSFVSFYKYMKTK